MMCSPLGVSHALLHVFGRVWHAHALLRTFAPVSVRDTGLWSFPAASVPGPGLRLTLASRNELGSVPCSPVSWEKFEGNCCYF